MIHTIDAGIPLRPLNPVSVATKIYSHEPHNSSGAHSTGKGFGLDSLWGVPPPLRAERISPRLEIQFRCAEKIVARTHHCLHRALFLTKEFVARLHSAEKASCRHSVPTTLRPQR